jgi:hypothetical protein
MGGEAGEKRVSLPALAFRYQLTAAAVRQALVASRGIDPEQAAAMWPSDDDAEEDVVKTALHAITSSAVRTGSHRNSGIASGVTVPADVPDVDADDEDEGRCLDDLDDQEDLDRTIERQHSVVPGQSVVGSARPRSSRPTTAATLVKPTPINRSATNRPMLACTSLDLSIVVMVEKATGLAIGFDMETGKSAGVFPPVTWPEQLVQHELRTSRGDIVGHTPRHLAPLPPSVAAVVGSAATSPTRTRAQGGDPIEATAVLVLAPFPLVMVAMEDGVMTAFWTRPARLAGQVAFMLLNWNAQRQLVAVTSMAWATVNNTLRVLVTGDTAGVVKLWPAVQELVSSCGAEPVRIPSVLPEPSLATRLAHDGADTWTATVTATAAASVASSPAKEVVNELPKRVTRRCDVLAEWSRHAQAAHHNASPTASTRSSSNQAQLAHTMATVFPSQCLLGHVESIRTVTVLGDPAVVVSIGNDYRVVLWAITGEYIGALLRRDWSEPALQVALTSATLPSLYALPPPPSPHEESAMLPISRPASSSLRASESLSTFALTDDPHIKSSSSGSEVDESELVRVFLSVLVGVCLQGQIDVFTCRHDNEHEGGVSVCMRVRLCVCVYVCMRVYACV